MDLRERPDGATRHPWEVSRARFVRRLIATHCSQPPTSVLDVGAGDSWFAEQLLEELPSTATIDCVDADYTADDLAESLPPRVRRRSTAPPTTQYPLVLALDVLEHVEDDRGFVADVIAPAVADGGTFIATVPAYQGLFTRHDVALGHFRRHSRASLHALLAPTFTIVAEGSLFASLVPPRAAQKLVERVRPPGGPADHVESAWSHGSLLTRTITGVLDVDARLGLAAARRHLPFPGLSVWAVCRMDRPS